MVTASRLRVCLVTRRWRFEGCLEQNQDGRVHSQPHQRAIGRGLSVTSLGSSRVVIEWSISCLTRAPRYAQNVEYAVSTCCVVLTIDVAQTRVEASRVEESVFNTECEVRLPSLPGVVAIVGSIFNVIGVSQQCQPTGASHTPRLGDGRACDHGVAPSSTSTARSPSMYWTNLTLSTSRS